MCAGSASRLRCLLKLLLRIYVFTGFLYSLFQYTRHMLNRYHFAFPFFRWRFVFFEVNITIDQPKCPFTPCVWLYRSGVGGCYAIHVVVVMYSYGSVLPYTSTVSIQSIFFQYFALSLLSLYCQCILCITLKVKKKKNMHTCRLT